MSDKHQLGDAPIESEYHAKMNALASVLDDVFNGDAKGEDRNVGFVLMVFPYGDKTGRCNYISNGADRNDVVVLMKEMIARFEGKLDAEEKPWPNHISIALATLKRS